MNDTLSRTLRQLRLSGLSETLEVRLQEAASGRLSHSEFLELILQDELSIRQDRLFNRRIKAATFRDQKSLEGFDWSFNAALKRADFYELPHRQVHSREPRFAFDRPTRSRQEPSGTSAGSGGNPNGFHRAVPFDF